MHTHKHNTPWHIHTCTHSPTHPHIHTYVHTYTHAYRRMCSWHMQGEMEESGVTKDSIYRYAGGELPCTHERIVHVWFQMSMFSDIVTFLGSILEVVYAPVVDLPGAGTPPPPPPFCFFITLFSSLLTSCRYVATPGLASSARNTVRCLKPNGLGTRPRSSMPWCTYVLRSWAKFEQERSTWRSWDLQSSYIWNLQCKARRCHESPSWY